MKKSLQFLLLAGVLIASHSAYAVSMGQVVGQITEKESGQPVGSAEIIFENSMDKIVVQANEHGFYYSDHMPTGRYQMRTVYNGRTFVINKVRVYDSYSVEVNFSVSSDSKLPQIVAIDCQEPIITSISPTDIKLSGSSNIEPTRPLGEILSMQPGMDVINGQIYIKGMAGVRFYIDGSPVMGPAMLGKGW